jgi:multicomponent K+:H+ antiporter subunit F
MSATLLLSALSFSQIALALAGCFAGWRILRGPRAQDRVLGLDTLYVTAMLLFLVTGMRTGSSFFFEAAMVIGLLGFVATVAMAKFLLRGEVIE